MPKQKQPTVTDAQTSPGVEDGRAIMIREGRPFPPSWPEILSQGLEITLWSQEAKWLQTSAHKLPYVVAECFCDVIHKNFWNHSWNNMEVLREVISLEIIKPLAIELQEEAQKCHSLFKKFSVHLDDAAPKRLGIRKQTKTFTPSDHQIIELIRKLDEIIWQAEILCSLGIKDKNSYQDLRNRWRQRIKDIGPKIRGIALDIIREMII
ncbi:MAG: hypothetical protein ACYC6G_09175 [Desulfobaccales bacterium]